METTLNSKNRVKRRHGGDRGIRKGRDLDVKRVKVYRLNEDGKWEDQGTGHVTVDYLERSKDLSLFVIDEDNKTLLKHRITPDDIYRKQEDTIISWRDSEYSTELALSFQDTTRCSYIWNNICNVQRNLHVTALNDDMFHKLNNELRELPTVELSTIPPRVKVYRLNEDGKWEDQGTGHVTVDYLERSKDLSVFVIDEEDNETLLMHRITLDDIYRKQKDTIILWRDPEYSTELALSFQDTTGCSYIWDIICNVQTDLNFTMLNHDTFHNVNRELRELPPELSTIPLISKEKLQVEECAVSIPEQRSDQESYHVSTPTRNIHRQPRNEDEISVTVSSVLNKIMKIINCVMFNKWLYRALNVILEVLQVTFTEINDRRKMSNSLCYKLVFGTSSICMLISLGEYIIEAKQSRVVWRRRGRCCWFYYPGVNGRLFGNLSLHFSVISSAIQFCVNFAKLTLMKKFNGDFTSLLFALLSLVSPMLYSSDEIQDIDHVN